MKTSFENTLGQSDMSGSAVAILGPGAVGGFLASVLWKHGGHVTCIGIPDEVKAIRQGGIHFQSSIFGTFTAFPEAGDHLKGNPAFLFITTKAPFLIDALMRVPMENVSDTVVVPLMNGFEHIEIIRTKLGKHVAVGMISGEMTKPNPQTVVHSSPHIRIELASDHDLSEDRLKSASRLLVEAGIETQVLPGEADVIWRKLARLNAIALITSASQEPIGFARSDPRWREKLESCVHEGVNVARVEGVDLDAGRIMEQIDALPEGLSTSMQRDLSKNAPSELEAISGAVLRLAGRQGIQCPVMQEMFQNLQDRSQRGYPQSILP